MNRSRFVKTTCNRDCPDACSIVAEVAEDRIVRLRGDKDHPVTRGALCFRTRNFLSRHHSADRITQPLLRRGDGFVAISPDDALDLAAEKLQTIRKESGGAAIFHYRSGGSLGMLKEICDAFFGRFGPVTIKVGDICNGAGEAAQIADFGESESHDIFDLHNARHIINWGKNLHVSNVHLIRVVTEARRRGADLTVIDPVSTQSAADADHHFALRPGGDLNLALAVGRRLFEMNLVKPHPACSEQSVTAFRHLCYERSNNAWAKAADVARWEVDHLAECLGDGPTAILIGWGLQRRAFGAATVRALDALCALSGNLGVEGGGCSFYFKRRGAFDTSFLKSGKPPRVIREPFFGEDVLAADAPPIRMIWVTAGNPVAMLPDSAKVAEAFEKTEFTVVVDAFHTDTTRRADLILPVTTLLEDDDLLGAYGHHYLGVSRPVLPPRGDARSDLEWIQGLASRLGMEQDFAGAPREWKERMLRPVCDRGASLEEIERGPVRNPLATRVLFSDGTVPTPDGKIRLLCAEDLPPSALGAEQEEPGGHPVSTPSSEPCELWLMSNSHPRSQSSQWVEEPSGPLEAIVHPDAARGMEEGREVCLHSALGELRVILRFDRRQRRDLVIVPKGGALDRGLAANALIPAKATDLGMGAAYQDTRVRLRPC